MKPVIKHCLVCGKLIEPPQKNIKRYSSYIWYHNNKKKTCSTKCSGKCHWTDEKRIKYREWALKHPVPKSGYEKRSEIYRGEKHWRWKGGVLTSPDYVYGDNWKEIRKEIYERDNWTCQNCGIKCTNKLGKTMIQCHHIKQWRQSKDNSMENLITLCLSCHMKEDFKYDREMRLSLKIIGAL